MSGPDCYHPMGVTSCPSCPPKGDKKIEEAAREWLKKIGLTPNYVDIESLGAWAEGLIAEAVAEKDREIETYRFERDTFMAEIHQEQVGRQQMHEMLKKAEAELAEMREKLRGYRNAAREEGFTVSAGTDTYTSHKCPQEWISPNGACANCARDDASYEMGRCELAESALKQARELLEQSANVIDSYRKGKDCAACDQPVYAEEDIPHLPDCVIPAIRAFLAAHKEEVKP